MYTTSTLAVKIDRSLNNGCTVSGAASGFWWLNWDKAQTVTTIVAIAKQRVVGVFSVSNPFQVARGNDKGRVGFHNVTELPLSSWPPFQAMEPFVFTGPFKYL